jgi:DNA-binding beta-propeller fold protein YncE
MFPSSVTVDPMGQFAYVPNALSNNVSAYSIDRITGALAAVVGSPFPAGSNPYSVTMHPTGQFAYVANCGTACNNSGVGAGNVSAYTIDGTTGALTAVVGSPFPAGGNPISVTVDAAGQFAYVANLLSNNVSAYIIDGITGALTAVVGSPFPGGSRPYSVTTTAGPQPPPATAAKN